MHTTELPFWVPKFDAADVTRKNFREKTVKVEERAVNFLLWKLRLKEKLIYWVNPDGVRESSSSVYWYPRQRVLQLLQELEEEATLTHYRFVTNGVSEFDREASAEFEQARTAAFSPKR